MALNDQQVKDLENKGFDLQLMNRYERSIFLLLNLSNTLVLDYEEYMKKFGVRGKSSELATKAKRSIENYLKQVREIIPEYEEVQFLLDYEEFESEFRKMADLRDFNSK